MNNKKLIQTKDKLSVRFYRNVFSVFLPRLLALLMVSTFLLQPLARVAAEENEVVAPATVELSSPETIDSLEESPPDSLPIVETLASPEVTIETQPSEVDVTDAATATQPLIVLNTATTTAIVSTTTSQATVVDAENITEETDVEESYSTDVVTPEDSGVEPAFDELVDETLLTESVGSSSTTLDPTVAVLTVQSDSLVQFDKNDCVAVADGSFYCQPKKSEPLKSEDGLFAYPDSDGDLEIYLRRNGELKQLTFNTVDDAAPYFDSVSNTIVWHRQISERYQIMSYDIERGVETQLTSDTVNNMEPTRMGQYTAWQRWSGDNWDIVLFNGKETTVLTTAFEHDIAPHIRGSLVVWNRIGRDQAQTIEIYDIQTGEYTTINDKEGGIISNPRMVLVYESSFENGDVITKGYDMQTGEIADLSATPASLPDRIPPPDDTGETRALIQGKLPTKEDLEHSSSSTPKLGLDPDPDSDTGTTTTIDLSGMGDNEATTTSATVDTTDMTVGTSTADFTLDMTATDIADVDEFQLIIPLFTASTTED